MSDWGHHCHCPLLMEMAWGLSNSRWACSASFKGLDWMKRLELQLWRRPGLVSVWEQRRIIAVIMMRKRSGQKDYRLSNNTHAINRLDYDQYLLWSMLLQAGQFDYHTQEIERDYYPEPHRPPYKIFYFSNWWQWLEKISCLAAMQ